MTIGTSLFIIAVGAILRYAVKDSLAGVDLPTAGLILMLVGAFGLILGIYFAFVRKEPDPTMGDPSLRAPR
jgi:fluoride ion exporter CrcB/FEX